MWTQTKPGGPPGLRHLVSVGVLEAPGALGPCGPSDCPDGGFPNTVLNPTQTQQALINSLHTKTHTGTI